MVHSVELLFDSDTEAAVRRIWDDLMDAGVRSQAAHGSASNRPHITVTVADRMDDAVATALQPVLARLPMKCVIGAPLLFGGRTPTLVRLVVPSVALLDVHAEVHRICLPHMPDGALPHTAPGLWTPHVTLARRVPPDRLPGAIALPGVSRGIRATVTGLRHWDGNAKVVHPIG